MGLAVITLSAADVDLINRTTCDEISELCYVYVTIQAMRNKYASYSITSSFLAANTLNTSQNIVQHLNFHTPTLETAKQNGDRSIYHFNVIASPMDFILSPCHGMPVLRAGVTDFFYRSYGGSNATVEKSEQVYVSSDVKFGEQ